MFWNLPNSLTMARIILIPVFVGIFMRSHTIFLSMQQTFLPQLFLDWLQLPIGLMDTTHASSI